MAQKSATSLPTKAAHGIPGASLDFEPVHFTFNVLYLALVAGVWISFTKTPIRKMNLVYGVKLQQHFVNGCVSCPGILGQYFDPILLHFTYNTIVYVPLIVVF